MGIIQGWITALGAIASLLIGLGTILVGVGTALTDPLHADWQVLSTTLFHGGQMIVAGIVALGLGRKLDKLKEVTKVAVTAPSDDHPTLAWLRDLFGGLADREVPPDEAKALAAALTEAATEAAEKEAAPRR